jgi:hypothetical protein
LRESTSSPDPSTTAKLSGLRVRASDGYLKALAGRHCKPGQSEVVLHGPHDILLLFQASGAQQVRKAGQFEKGDIGMLATHGAAIGDLLDDRVRRPDHVAIDVLRARITVPAQGGVDDLLYRLSRSLEAMGAGDPLDQDVEA